MSMYSTVRAGDDLQGSTDAFAPEAARMNLSMPTSGVPHQDDGFAAMVREMEEEQEIDWDDPTFFYPFACPCHGKRFQKRADLNRHLNKENQRFKCLVAGCPSTGPDGAPPCFGTQNDKKRHYRDVHGMDLNGQPLARYRCPWTYCKRHVEGFPRQKNLENHLKSLHDGKRPEADEATEPAVESGTILAPQELAAPEAVVAGPSSQRVPSAANLTPQATQLPEEHDLSAENEEDDEVLLAYQEDFSKLRADLQALSNQINQMQSQYTRMEATEDHIRNRLEERRHILRQRKAASTARRG